MIGIIKGKLQPLYDLIKPIKGITFFLFLFLFFELIWKICIHLGPDQEQLLFLGYNLTNTVYPICVLDAKIVYWIIHDVLGYQNFHINGTVIFFENALKMNIIWTCTSIKQILMFSFIMIFYWGPPKKKLKFIPLSLIFLSLTNFLRLVISCFLLKNGFPEWFIPINEILNGVSWETSQTKYWIFYRDWYHFFHDGFFKWIYYDGILFIIWLLWQEKFNIPYQKFKQKL